jgi:hypothetical protein
MDTSRPQATPVRGWRSVLDRSALVATVVGLPFILLLMYCAWLPLLMGMYFFILGGMLIGAIWCRLARRVRPVPAGAVRLRMFVMLAIFVVVYLLAEYKVKVMHLVRDMTELTIQMQSVDSLGQRQQREREVADHVRQSLRKHGPGPLGYLAWAATDGRLPPMTRYTGKAGLVLPQRQAFYILRVVLSITLLWYGLRLMAKDLSRPDEVPDPSIRETPVK